MDPQSVSVRLGSAGQDISRMDGPKIDEERERCSGGLTRPLRLVEDERRVHREINSKLDRQKIDRWLLE